MTKVRFSESQMAVACNITQAYALNNGTGGTDIQQRAAVLGILAVLTGRITAIPEPYRKYADGVELYSDNTGEADLAAEEAVAVEGVSVLVSQADYDRWQNILTGLTISNQDRTITLSQEACDLLQGPEFFEAAPFPEVGVYIPFTRAEKMVEEALALVDDEDDGQEPNGDGSADKVAFEDMTVKKLREFAAENSVDVTGATDKASIIALLREANF